MQIPESFAERKLKLAENLMNTILALQGRYDDLIYETSYFEAAERIAKENNLSLVDVYNSDLVIKDQKFNEALIGIYSSKMDSWKTSHKH